MATNGAQNERIEVRTTAAERALIDGAKVVLDVEAAEAWDTVNRRPARDLPGLRSLVQRPSPFTPE